MARPPNSSSLPITNRLLLVLSSAARKLLLVNSEPVQFSTGQVLSQPDEAIPYVYFPNGGVIAKIVPMSDGESAEAGLVGHEGMVPLCGFLGFDITPFRAVVQNSGDALRVRTEDFNSAVSELPSLQNLMLRYTGFFLTQLSQSAACNRLHTAEQRCCRWLLMTHDRMGSDQFSLTHEFIANMLGVRRMSINQVARRLQRAGFIRYRHGQITLVNRQGLEATSCECYQRIRRWYEMLNRRSSP